MWTLPELYCYSEVRDAAILTTIGNRMIGVADLRSDSAVECVCSSAVLPAVRGRRRKAALLRTHGRRLS